MVNVTQLTYELKRDEGVRRRRYMDSLHKATIGVGHLLVGPNDPLWDKTLTDQEIDSLLAQDINIAINRIKNKPFYLKADTDARKRALINMSFQLGSNLFEFHNSLNEIAQGKWHEAGERLKLSLWHRQTPERAERVISMLENG